MGQAAPHHAHRQQRINRISFQLIGQCHLNIHIFHYVSFLIFLAIAAFATFLFFSITTFLRACVIFHATSFDRVAVIIFDLRGFGNIVVSSDAAGVFAFFVFAFPVNALFADGAAIFTASRLVGAACGTLAVLAFFVRFTTHFILDAPIFPFGLGGGRRLPQARAVSIAEMFTPLLWAPCAGTAFSRLPPCSR